MKSWIAVLVTSAFALILGEWARGPVVGEAIHAPLKIESGHIHRPEDDRRFIM
jgi:hypothetical protein